MTDRKPWLILAAGVVLAAAIITGAAIATGGDDPAATAASSDEARTLPDGTTATPAQDAYLEAVNPTLTPEHAADVLAVLGAGDGVCSVWLHPSDPAPQAQAVQMLMTSSGYNQTEATVIARAAAEHLCPDK